MTDSKIQYLLIGSSGSTAFISYLKSNLWVVGVIAFLALGALGAGLKYLDEDAGRELARRANTKGAPNNQPDQSFLNKVNPFLPALTPTPTPQLSKEYIYAGSRMLAVEDANAAPVPLADLIVWRPSGGDWYVRNQSGSTQYGFHWGMNGDVPTPGDYDGDGKLDFAIWRASTTPSNSYWWVYRSSDNSYFNAPLGSSGDIPVAADYDGDSKTDLAVYTPANSMWWIFLSGSLQYYTPQWGLSGDVPAPGDYDGDGKADVAVWRPSDKQFYILTSSSTYYAVSFAAPLTSAASSEPVPADYDGDGKVDPAVRKSGTADWIILQSSNNQFQTVSWQQSTDIPVPGDYDGDGKADVAVWRNSDGYWHIRKSGSGGALQSVQWGMTGDTAVPAYYRR